MLHGSSVYTSPFGETVAGIRTQPSGCRREDSGFPNERWSESPSKESISSVPKSITKVHLPRVSADRKNGSKLSFHPRCAHRMHKATITTGKMRVACNVKPESQQSWQKPKRASDVNVEDTSPNLKSTPGTQMNDSQASMDKPNLMPASKIEHFR